MNKRELWPIPSICEYSRASPETSDSPKNILSPISPCSDRVETKMYSAAKYIGLGAAVFQALAAKLLSKNASFPWCLLYSLAIIFFCYALFYITIYPRWFSPLRHLPRPRVSNSATRKLSHHAHRHYLRFQGRKPHPRSRPF